ncbi:MAG TPA: dTDP-4-dehydrorhamnose 3,5-epimerase [Jatrophihabitantaceae bacterium]|nr:dTDP-4-dehydrorhamnose 3,5-epimerase [Mycobacteriales bacterium]HZY77646.1 dTDP-4-dehydrorhamnose 3,5-epimerase [Jatrophihabitantaceae bacterium]
MKITELAVPGAWRCVPDVHHDDRGEFLEWFRADLVGEAAGRRFDVAQANHSVSDRGVVRGVHFADTPPGQSKVVYCVEGEAIDVIVDLRVGSPTYGQHDSVLLNAVDRQVVVIAEGLGHAFCATRDRTSLAYLVSAPYNPEVEHTVSPLDPELGLPWPLPADELRLSPRDAAAPTLEQARAAGVLPSYDACQAWYAERAVV